MQIENSQTIKDKLPEDYHLPSQPLFYCEEDDTLHTTRRDASYHYHKCLVDKAVRTLRLAQQTADESLFKMRLYKVSTLPMHQKELNRINARLKELLSEKDWRKTHITHGEKRREILLFRYRRIVAVKLLHDKMHEYKTEKLAYRNALDSIVAARVRIEEEKIKAKEAEEFWKTQKEK